MFYSLKTISSKICLRYSYVKSYFIVYLLLVNCSSLDLGLFVLLTECFQYFRCFPWPFSSPVAVASCRIMPLILFGQMLPSDCYS